MPSIFEKSINPPPFGLRPSIPEKCVVRAFTTLDVKLARISRHCLPPSLVLVLGSVIGGVVLSSILKLGIDRPRPNLVARLVEEHTASFPSGDAMLSAVVYLTLGGLLSRVERPAVSKSTF
jgi:membrane-associated phospholipid phosphatase